MKRLLKKVSRLKRKLMAEWTPVDPNSEDVVQIITDAMAAGTQIQIEYEGSGWRLIQPYGWNSSQEGNILLMCYKDTGEVRSYRLDRVLQVLVDDTMLANEPTQMLSPDNMYQVEDYKANPSDFEIPLLPNQDEVLQLSENEPGMEAPYDKGIQYLTLDTVPVETPNEDNNLINPHNDTTPEELHKKIDNEEQKQDNQEEINNQETNNQEEKQKK